MAPVGQAARQRLHDPQRYPMISLGYVFIALLAWVLFGENVTPTRLAEIFITCLGVFIIARSSFIG